MDKETLDGLFTQVPTPEPEGQAENHLAQHPERSKEDAHRPARADRRVEKRSERTKPVEGEANKSPAQEKETASELAKESPFLAWVPKRFLDWLGTPGEDKGKEHHGQLFGILLLASSLFMLGLSLVAGLLRLGGVVFPTWIGLGIPVGGFFVPLLSLWLLKRGRVNAGIWFYSISIFIVNTLATLAVSQSSGIPIYFLWTITVVGLLLKPAYALWAALAASGATLLVFGLQHNGVYEAPVVLSQQVKVFVNVGNWITIFMTIALMMYVVLENLERILEAERELRQELAAQQAHLATEVKERTRLLQEANYEFRKRAIHLEASAKVSRAAASILAPQELMQTTVDLIRSQFNLYNFYHVSIFLLDEKGHWAIVRASTGEVGRQMMTEPHRLKVGGESMVGWVCAHNEARIALDVGEDAVHFNHPLLPHTRSEIVLPLRIKDQVVGALDVQSTEADAFDEDDVRTLQGMADLVAIALENARLFSETRRRAQHQQLVAKVSDHLQHTGSTAEVLATTLTDVVDIFDLAGAAICLQGQVAKQTRPPGTTIEHHPELSSRASRRIVEAAQRPEPVEAAQRPERSEWIKNASRQERKQ